jgi:hypothetical protein
LTHKDVAALSNARHKPDPRARDIGIDARVYVGSTGVLPVEMDSKALMAEGSMCMNAQCDRRQVSERQRSQKQHCAGQRHSAGSQQSEVPPAIDPADCGDGY